MGVILARLTVSEWQELSDKLCNGISEIRRHHSYLPGYAGMLADLESAESDLLAVGCPVLS